MMKRIHRLTGIIISVFITVHLLNHLLILTSEEAHLEFMKAIRLVYRNAVIETILLLCIAIQVITGIGLAIKKWKEEKSIIDRLQLVSGLFLFYFLIVHTSAVMYCRVILKLDSNLYFGASGLNNDPIFIYFIFHYGLAIISFFTHVACAHRKKITTYVTVKTANAHALIIIVMGIVIASLVIYKMMHINIPKAYQLPYGEYEKH